MRLLLPLLLVVFACGSSDKTVEEPAAEGALCGPGTWVFTIELLEDTCIAASTSEAMTFHVTEDGTVYPDATLEDAMWSAEGELKQIDPPPGCVVHAVMHKNGGTIEFEMIRNWWGSGKVSGGGTATVPIQHERCTQFVKIEGNYSAL